MRHPWSFRGRLLLPGRRDSEDFGAIRSWCDLLLVIILQQRCDYLRSLHGFSHFVFISMLLWCFFRLRIKPRSHLVVRVSLAEISHLACCVLFVVMNLGPPSSINEVVSLSYMFPKACCGFGWKLCKYTWCVGFRVRVRSLGLWQSLQIRGRKSTICYSVT